AEADRMLAKYDAVNKTDAQGYITLDRFREIMMGLGRWTPKHESYMPLLRRGELPEEIMHLYQEYLQLQHSEMQPLKGVHFEVTTSTGSPIPVYLKYSQAVLFPALTKDTTLDKLRVQMEA